MGGFFGVAAKRDCVLELFYGVDYHSHLGTRRGGMATYGEGGFNRAIHNIENSPFRTKFDRDVGEMKGYMGIGCISDFEPQPLLIQSHLGSFAITTVGKINNFEELLKEIYKDGPAHFQEMTNGQINATELVAALICKRDSLVERMPTASPLRVLLISTWVILITRNWGPGKSCVSIPMVWRCWPGPEKICGSVPSFGYTTGIPPLLMRGLTWSRCVTIAATCWQNGIRGR